MEFLIKQEPNYGSCVISNDATSCCSLCSDGMDILKDLVQHHRYNHSKSK